MWDKRFLIICCSALVDPLIINAYSPLVQEFKTAFNVDVSFIALSLTFHMLPLALLSLFSGTFSDLYYRPKILMYGLFVSSLGSVLGASSPTILVFLLSRSIQGLGSALIMPVASALMGDIIPRNALGKAMGVQAIFTGFFGVVLGPLFGSFFAGIMWRVVPLILAAYTFLLGLLSRLILRNMKLPEKKSVSLLLHKLKQIARNRNIALLCTTGFISMFCYQGIQPILSDSLSLSPLLITKNEIAVLFSTIGIIRILFSFLGGILADKIGPRRTMITGFLVEVLAAFLLTSANSYGSYLLWLAVLAGFNNLTMISRTTLVLSLVPEARGTASSLSSFASFLGFSSAPIISTQIYIASGIGSVFLFDILLLFLCALFALFLRITPLRKEI
ncbi:MFS transporter [Candidatus Bathyarchaeota archaeon]|nr:MFS transporter [Candidatus Bathyarchaeota archaeon]